MPAVDVSVIIVTFNSADCIAACVESVLAQSGPSFEIIVVDNASKDDTLARLKGLPVRVIASEENLGFGRGNNLGFPFSNGRYIYLLNPDARLMSKKALADLCFQMDTNGRWGMAGTRVCSADGRLQGLPAVEYPGARHVRRDFSKLPGRIAWIMGASMFIRRAVYEKLKGFDPGFFLYSEETDICLRLRELGYEIGYVSEVAVNHIGGASEDLRDPYDVSARKLKGLLVFRQKHYAPEDCLSLAKRDFRRAWWRMVWNGALARLQRSRSNAWHKHRQYRAIFEVTQEHLAALKQPAQ